MVGGWFYRQLAKQSWTLTVNVAERCTLAQFWTTEMINKRPPTSPRSQQNPVSRNNCRCCFCDFERKFQYVSDQLELNSKQHQVVKGRFVSYLQEQVVDGFNSSCYDIHWRKRTCWNTCFCFVLLKQDKQSEENGTQKSRMS